MSKAGVLLLALVAASGCSASPTGPDPGLDPSPALAVNPLTQPGLWNGFIRVDSCTDRGQACGPTRAGTLSEFTLRTIASGSSVTGLLESSAVDHPIALEGVLKADGSAQLSGSLGNTWGEPVSYNIVVTALHVAADPESGLSGSIAMWWQQPGDRATFAGTIVSASMRPFTVPVDRRFEGTWAGRGIVRRCTGNCFTYEEGDGIEVRLRISQLGSAITGEYGDVPISGAAAGNDLTLTGERRWVLDPEFGAPAFSFKRIESFLAHADELGRLTGTFRYVIKGIESQSFRDVPFAGTLDVEMVGVIRTR